MRLIGYFLVVLTVALALSPFPAHAATAAIIHVAPTGDDSQPGSASQPLRTLEGARDRARTLRSGGNEVEIVLHGGRYERDRSFVLGPEDGGRAGAPVVYRAAEGERVVVTGSRAVPESAVTNPVDPAVLARLDPAVAPRVRRVDLRALGVADLGTRQAEVTGADRPTQVQLIQGDTVGHDARYPNRGTTLKIGAVQSEGDRPVWRIEDRTPFTWTSSEDVWVEGFPGFDWAYQVLAVVSRDAATSTITLGSATEFGSKVGQPFAFVHVLEGLDHPDEFFVDSSTGQLYFLPTGQPLSVTVLAEPLVMGTNTSHVRFEGIEFSGARGDGIKMTGGAGIEIRDSRFTGLGLRAIQLIDVTGATVDGVDISHVGRGGVDVSGGDRATLTPGRNVISNNTIAHFAEHYPRYSPGIAVAGVGNVVRNNEVSHSPHLALHLRGNDQLIESNYVHDVVQEGSDSGALYAGRDWSERGNVIANNVFARIGSGPEDVSAIYLDDMFSGTLVRQNVVVDAAVGVQHNGRNNDVTGNIFVRTRRPVYVGNWSQEISGPGGVLEQRLSAVPYTSPAWAKYPGLATILSDEPRLPKYDTVTSNAFIESGSVSISEIPDSSVRRSGNHALPASTLTTGTELRDYRIPSTSLIHIVPGLTVPDLARVGPGAAGPAQPKPAPLGVLLALACGGVVVVLIAVAVAMARRLRGRRRVRARRSPG